MKLTPKQKEIIDKAIELEHGLVADEVFIRFVNDRYGYCFVFHKKGSRYFNAAFEYGFNPIKINLRTLKSLCEKGVLEDVDIQHNPCPSCMHSTEEYLGVRVKTELFKEDISENN